MQKQDDQSKQPTIQPKPDQLLSVSRPIDVNALRTGHPQLGVEQLQRVAGLIIGPLAQGEANGTAKI